MTAFDPRIPFSRADARAAGVPVSALRGSGYRRLFRDRYVASSVEVTTHLRARAALSIAGPGSRVSHGTAAELLGGWVPEHPDTHVTVPEGGCRSRTQGIRGHRRGSEDEEVVHRGLLLSSPLQCVREMADDLGLVDLVILGDSLVRAAAITPEELVAGVEGWSGSSARLARRAMRLVREGVDSPMETRLRLLLVLAGLPEPVVAVEVMAEDGRFVARLDLSWPRWKVAAEYEGRQHSESPTQWGRDIDRREGLDALTWRLVLVRAEGIYREPWVTLDRVVRTLTAAGADVGIRSDEWRRHFPGYRMAA